MAERKWVCITLILGDMFVQLFSYTQRNLQPKRLVLTTVIDVPVNWHIINHIFTRLTFISFSNYTRGKVPIHENGMTALNELFSGQKLLQCSWSPSWGNYNEQTISFWTDFSASWGIDWVPPSETSQISQQYDTEGLKRSPQLCPHFAERLIMPKCSM